MNPLDPFDPENLKGFAGLATLAAQYLKEKSDIRAEASADDFRRWLKDEAMPLMESQAAAIFHVVVSAKVENRERFERLELLLEEIRDGLATYPGMRVWRSLSDLERAMLTLAYQEAETTIDFDNSIDCNALATKLQVSADDTWRAAKLLQDHKLVQLQPLSGGCRAVRCTYQGISLAWTALRKGERVAGERRLVAALPEGSKSARLRDLSQYAAVPPGLTWVALQEWEAAGFLKIRRYDAARDHATIYGVTEKLRREVLA